MQKLKVILYIVGCVFLFALSPLLIGAITTWAIGIIFIYSITILVVKIGIVCFPNNKISNKFYQTCLIILNVIPTLINGAKSKIDKIVIIIAGIIGGILFLLDCYILGKSLWWIPILVGIILYFLLDIVKKDKNHKSKVLDEKHSIQLIKSEKECYDIAIRGVDYLKTCLNNDDINIEALLLSSAILLDIKDIEHYNNSCNMSINLLQHEILKYHNISDWEYLFACNTPGMLYDNDYGCPLIDFIKDKGRLEICVNEEINNGKPICLFTDSIGNKTYVFFSEQVGLLSEEELNIKKEQLCVVERYYNCYFLINNQEVTVKDMLTDYISERLSIYIKLVTQIQNINNQNNDILVKYLYTLLTNKKYQFYVYSEIEDATTLNKVEDLDLVQCPGNFNEIIHNLINNIKNLDI